MIFFPVDMQLFGILFLIVLVCWIFYKIIDFTTQRMNKPRIDHRRRCPRCSDIFPTNSNSCISCGYTASVSAQADGDGGE